jgi:hypothetical protein
MLVVLILSTSPWENSVLSTSTSISSAKRKKMNISNPYVYLQKLKGMRKSNIKCYTTSSLLVISSTEGNEGKEDYFLKSGMSGIQWWSSFKQQVY